MQENQNNVFSLTNDFEIDKIKISFELKDEFSLIETFSLTTFEGINLSDDFLSPTRNLSIKLSGIRELDESVINKILIGAKCVCSYKEIPIFIGYVYSIDESVNSGGSSANIQCKDFMYLLEDSTIEKPIVITGNETLRDIVTKICGPILKANQIGLSFEGISPNQKWYSLVMPSKAETQSVYDPVLKKTIFIDTTTTTTTSTTNVGFSSKTRKLKEPSSLKDFQTKIGDGIWQSLQKVLNYAGLTARGAFTNVVELLEITKPADDDSPSYELDRRYESYTRSQNLREQIPIFIATGHGSDNLNFRNVPIKSVALNEFTAFDKQGKNLPAIQTYLDLWKAKPLPTNSYLKNLPTFIAKTTRYSLFEKNSISSQKALDNFVFRKMRDRQQKACVLNFTVPGWSIQDVVIHSNSIIHIKFLDTSFFIKSVNYNFSNSGVTTSFECVHKYTMNFGDM